MGSVVERLKDALRASGHRLTPQRQLILEVLAESGGHLDATELYDLVRARDRATSLATIYRTLAVLKELGQVEEDPLGQDHSHYEATPDEPHYHFTCLKCGKVIEFDTPLVRQIEQELCEREGFGVSHTYLHMSGYCAECRDMAH